MDDFDEYSRPRYKRVHNLFMTRADADLFSEELRSAFPQIRFVSRDYWRPFIDWAAYAKDFEEQERRHREKLPDHEFKYKMSVPRGEALPCWKTLGTPQEHQFLVWLEPEDWKPKWTAPDRRGRLWLENIPASSFLFERPYFSCRKRIHTSPADPPTPLNDSESLLLNGRRFETRWHDGDRLSETLAKTAFRILRRQTVDRFYDVESDSRRALFPETFHRPAFYLAGRGAAAWACSRRHNYLDGAGGILKPAGFVFRPDEIFSEQELAERHARLDAEFEARCIQHEAEFAAKCAELGIKPRAPRRRKQRHG